MWQLYAAGDDSDYSTEVIAVLAALLADFLGIDLSALVLTVVPASVQLRATITTTSDASVLLATKIDSVTAEQATEVFSGVSALWVAAKWAAGYNTPLRRGLCLCS